MGKRKKKQMAMRSPIRPRIVPKFDRTHFPSLPLARQFYCRFMPRPVISSWYVDMDGFDELSICGKSVKRLLEIVGWKNALSIEDNVYPNLIRAFYSNMKISASRQDRILNNMGGVPI